MAAKDFSLIESDYAFFMGHSTEAVQDIAEYARELAGFADGRESIRLLDFGCGTGEFSEQFLTAMDWPAERLEIGLVEPVESHRRTATQRLARWTRRSMIAIDGLSSQLDGRFDLILSNHALYYVDRLDDTLGQMLGGVAPGGKLLLALAGWENRLMQLWITGFSLLGQPVPYYAAEDVATFFSQRNIPFRQQPVDYKLQFPDTQANRMKILRFLFGEYLEQISPQKLLGEFDGHVRGDQIEMVTHSTHFVVETKGNRLK